ncbi:hypothetical protein [uncultured Leifsonia sp.]|uniref:hypothetical protein n=1 Tax=uncultured Leifsonia sp. TaxID=340359 RepID=UPI0028D72002|nr:hypothetical protein [uncultured Leifsonia sp.]
MTQGELDSETGLRVHGAIYKLIYIASVVLPRPLLVLGGIGAGVDIFVRQMWLGVLWGCLAGAGIALYGVAKIMDFDELRGLPGAGRTLMLGVASLLVGAALIILWIVLGTTS